MCLQKLTSAKQHNWMHREQDTVKWLSPMQNANELHRNISGPCDLILS